MTRPRLALLNAAHAAGDTSRNFRRELDADLVEFRLVHGDRPDGYDYDGFVVTGSASSAYDDDEWIRAAKTWCGEAIERGLPGLGICFGHQLLADVLGGTVEAMGEYEIGYREVEKVNDDPLLSGLGDRFLVFTTHGDAVTELPPGATRTLENEYGIHGFRKGNVATVQAHPEYDTETAETVTRGKDLPEERIESVVDGITPENYSRACETKRLFENFLGEVRERRAATADD
ncbi:type 1 glutamine amidotransferase [Halosegnis marinus]|uniref:Type 1 glutamine amidotransferase n=1 Tax=Halosegnis marinus TaxID=3034023 RepID=A0ABD5ZNB2_9EURY|nr:type 1 glutamine amidotransferase [Halosegnis sp. DT85]